MKIRSLCILLLAVAAGGCVGIPRDLETPEVSFVGLTGLQASLFEQQLDLRMRVRNPNSIELPVNGLDVDLELAGEPFARGASVRQFVIPARGEAEFDMRVTANAATAILRILGGERSSREDVDYRLKGKLSTRIGMLRSIPFDEAGTLRLSDLVGKRRDDG